MTAAKDGYSDRNRRYENANLLRVLVKFNRRTEKPLVERMESVPNRAGYLKRLVQEDIERDKGGDHDADEK